LEALGFENSGIHGRGARIDVLADGQADFVFTSRPYSPKSICERIRVSESGDLAMDPLAGFGTVLEMAVWERRVGVG
jgi:hypothetical protein